MLRVRTSFCAVAAVLLGAPLITPAAYAASTTLSCGQTITADTILRADLVNCPDSGVVIGADNITLDLNGHTIDGDGQPTSGCATGGGCDLGVDNSSGRRGVTVMGGSVRQFRIGVLIAGGAVNDRLRHIAISENADFGVIVDQATGTGIEGSTMADNGTSGLVVIKSPHSSVRGNAISGSGGIGMGLFGVDASVIGHNVLRGNDQGIVCDACAEDLIDGNAVTHSSGSSIDFSNGAAGNRIQHNRLTNNGDGIVGTNAHDNVVSHNVVTGTGFFGAPDTGGFGLIFDGSSYNTVADNIITGGRGPAVLVTSLDSPQPSEGNLISRNHVTSKFADGILLENGAKQNVVIRNVASRNGDDGIDANATTTLTRNIANRNHDLGIEADPGVTDGGRNHAARNGNPAQCTGVTCAD